MAIVSCPECSKKSKVADDKLGKKVKGVCGHIFVASAQAAPPKAAAPASDDRVIVACTSCMSKLKIPSASVGKKLRCLKCQGVFVATVSGAPAAAPKPAPKPAPPPPEPAEDDDEVGLPKKSKNAVTDDDMDDLLSFAEKDKEKEEKSSDVDLFGDDDDKPKPKGKKGEEDDDDLPAPKGKKKADEDDDDLPKPKGKKKVEDDDEDEDETPRGKKAAKPPAEDAAPPVYPSRMGINLLVAFLLLGFLTFFGLIYSRVVVLPLPKYTEDKPRQPRGDDDFGLIEGKWLVESAEREGKSVDSYKGKEVVFEEEKVTIDFFTPPLKAGAVTLKPGQPGVIEIVAEKVTFPGVYKVADNKLHLCINNAKKVEGKEEYEQPKDFKSDQGLLLVLAKVEKKAEDNKEALAKIQIKTLQTACDAYFLNASVYPDTLEQLTQKDAMGKVYIEAPALRDPWDKAYMYDKAGPKNNGMRPDIWTKTPDDKVIGNWKDDAPAKSNYSRSLSADNLKNIGVAIHNYHEAMKRLPAAGFGTPTSEKPLLSWRVAILPYIEQLDLYKEFDLTKAWDDSHNMKLIAKMPKIYMIPGVDAKEGMTHYRTLVGPGTLLDPIKGGPRGFSPRYMLANIPDGLSNVIMVVEAAEPTIWTKPDDLPYDPKAPLPKFGVAPSGFNVLFGDARVEFVSPKVPEAVLRPYLTGDNGMTRHPLDGTKPKDKKDDGKNGGPKVEKKDDGKKDEAKRQVSSAKFLDLSGDKIWTAAARHRFLSLLAHDASQWARK